MLETIQLYTIGGTPDGTVEGIRVCGSEFVANDFVNPASGDMGLQVVHIPDGADRLFLEMGTPPDPDGAFRFVDGWLVLPYALTE